MRFADCMAGVETIALRDAAVAIAGVEYDSRRVRAGSLFVAMRGGTTDGNRYVDKALQQGASAIVTDDAAVFAALPAHVASAQIANGRRALAAISANLFGHPEAKLKLTAVTGTNGKTTTAFLTESILNYAQRKSVLLGTIETHIAGEVLASPHTTPESRDVLEIFAKGVAADATEAVMEMSSHALEQERVWGLPVDVAIFTNLTQDHLDYHKTMDAYADAKARLFKGIGASAPRVAIINGDDEFTAEMILAAQGCGTIWDYSLTAVGADFFASRIELGIGQTRFLLRTPVGEVAVQSQLTGSVNVANLMAAMAAAMARGLTLQQCVDAAAVVKPVAGRFEAVPNTLGVAVIVDYAHTDDALTNLTSLARSLARDARVITMFGCGGDRDRTKRPKMGRAAGRGSDLVVVTSDNPRTEDPAAIVAEILPGVEETGTPHVVEMERGAAIEHAIRAARAGDVVLLAGKGHEKEQVLATGTVPFDDVEVAERVLRRMEEGR